MLKELQCRHTEEQKSVIYSSRGGPVHYEQWRGMEGSPVGHFMLFSLTRWQWSRKISCILKSIFPTDGH